MVSRTLNIDMHIASRYANGGRVVFYITAQNRQRKIYVLCIVPTHVNVGLSVTFYF